MAERGPGRIDHLVGQVTLEALPGSSDVVVARQAWVRLKLA
jgi:hypothetical protein